MIIFEGEIPMMYCSDRDRYPLHSSAVLQRRDHPRLGLSWPVSLLVWGVAGASGAAAVYGISPYNLLRDAGVATPCTDRHPPLVDRVMFNGFAKVDISISTLSTYLRRWPGRWPSRG